MMKKTFMALALTLLPFGMASAQVRMLVVPKDGTAPKSFNLDDIRRIDFLGEANTFSIACAILDLRLSAGGTDDHGSAVVQSVDEDVCGGQAGLDRKSVV